MKVSNIIAGIVAILVLIIVGTVFTQTQTPVEEPVNPITVVDYEGRIVPKTHKHNSLCKYINLYKTTKCRKLSNNSSNTSKPT